MLLLILVPGLVGVTPLHWIKSVLILDAQQGYELL